MKYVSLHHHSTYSWLDGFGHPKDHVARAAELGMSAMALTEHGTISSHPKLEQAAKEAGIKPIYGCELYCGGEEKVQRKNHLTVLAENQIGYRNLMSVVSWAWSEEGFYYEPTATGRVLARHRRGLVILSGCTGSLLATSLIGGKNVEKEDASFDRGLNVARRFLSTFGDAYYLEVQAFPELEESTCILNPQLAKIARRLHIPLVATHDIHYPLPEHNKIQTILHAVRPGTRRTFEEEERSWGYDVPLTLPKNDATMLKRLIGTGLTRRQASEAIANTAEIAQRCTLDLPKASPLSFPLPNGYKDSNDLFVAWLREGWMYRRISEQPDPQRYAERLSYEVKMIRDKDFVDYFLITSDMVKAAKGKGIFVGPARGSAAASLVCYLLRITEVNPMIFPDLVFERFIDITRKDLPDIDLDFDDQRRHEVFEYLREKYGEEHVNQLGTFSTYKTKSALDDVARVFQIPKWEVDTIKDLMIFRSSGDLRASSTIEDSIEMFAEVKEVFERNPDLYNATKIEGMVKGMGKHAAGAIVSSTPLTETCAVYKNTISLDKFDAEYLNLLKLDVLGLSTCGMLAAAMEMLDKPNEFLYSVPLDDEETLRGFKENDIVGIFQFDGRAMRLVNNALNPDSFYECCVVNALARPGPLHNNAMTDYVDIKHGQREPELRHPLFDDIVKNTQFQVVYQEQILRIVREIGLFSWTASTHIRKIISHKEGEQAFNREWLRFWKGAKKNGLDQELAKKIWGMCITAGSYAFNAAHSVSYGMLAWWTMWLKRHHPDVFYLAALQRLPDTKHLELMRDAVRHGIQVLPPDPEVSGVGWKLKDGALQAGFDQIKGIGPKQAQAIVDYRNREAKEGWSDRRMRWPDLIAVKGIGPKTIENILEFMSSDDPLGVHILDRTLKKIIKQIRSGDLRGSNGRRLPVPTHTTSQVPYGRGEDTEVVWIGVVSNRNLRDLFEVNFSRTGVPLDPKKTKRPDLREWMLLYGTDGDDVLTFNVDRFRYLRFKKMLWDLKLGRDIVLIRGVKKGWAPHKIVYVSEMTVFGE